jgi:hypothetical protein
MADLDYENMSDDDIAKMERPPEQEVVSQEDPSAQEQEQQANAEQKAADEAQAAADEQAALDAAAEAAEAEGNEDPDEDEGDEGKPAVEGSDDPEERNPLGDDDDAPAPKKPEVKADPKEKPAEGKPGDKPAAEAKEEEKTPAVDYEAKYKEIMKPFKANGRDVNVNSPEEAIQLMQMGANYTKKLQALAPNLRMMQMLENQGLLNEDKLTYLIDLSKKNPEAIRKLIADSGIDPLDIDTTVEPGYKPGEYSVSQEQMVFNDTIRELNETDAGKDTIAIIHKNWDKESKQAIYTDPKVLRVITTHKESGLFDQISGEVERQKMLGNYANVPYLNAYYAVGQQMSKDGRLQQQAAPAQEAQAAPPPQQRQVLETRSAPRKPAADPNADKAKAASPVRTAPKRAAQEFNPLSMSDEDFEKNASMAKRL